MPRFPLLDAFERFFRRGKYAAAPESFSRQRPTPVRFNPLAASAVPIEYRYDEKAKRWETFDRGLPYGWVASDALAVFRADARLTVEDIIAARMLRGYQNNRPILIVEPVPR